MEVLGSMINSSVGCEKVVQASFATCRRPVMSQLCLDGATNRGKAATLVTYELPSYFPIILQRRIFQSEVLKRTQNLLKLLYSARHTHHNHHCQFGNNIAR